MRIFNLYTKDQYLWNNWHNTYVEVLKEECFSLEKNLLYFNPDYFIINNSDKSIKIVDGKEQGLTANDLNDLGLRKPILINNEDDTEYTWSVGEGEPPEDAASNGEAYFDYKNNIFYVSVEEEGFYTWTTTKYQNAAIYLPQKLTLKQGLKNLDINAYLWWEPDFSILENIDTSEKTNFLIKNSDSVVALYFNRRLWNKFSFNRYLVYVQDKIDNVLEEYKLFDTNLNNAEEFASTCVQPRIDDDETYNLNYDMWRTQLRIVNGSFTYYFDKTYDVLTVFPSSTVLICRAQELSGIDNSAAPAHNDPANFNIFAQGAYGLYALQLQGNDLIATYNDQGSSDLGTQSYFTLDVLNNRYILNDSLSTWGWNDTKAVTLYAALWPNEQTIEPTQKNIINVNNNIWDGGNEIMVTLKTKKTNGEISITYDNFYSDTIYTKTYTKIANKAVATYTMTDNILSQNNRQGFIDTSATNPTDNIVIELF